MVHLGRTKPEEVKGHLSDAEVQIVVDALLHEMERYNKAMDLVTDENARAAIEWAKKPLKELHTKFCHLLDPDQE